MRTVLYGLLAAIPLAAPAAAQQCENTVMVGNFEIEFNGAVYDGFNTNFSYCVTGVDTEGFHDLSNWGLALDETCINPEDLVACGPEPCFYQVDDPNTGLTGIKFDDLVVGPGQTVCFDFTLAGDWTNHVGEVTVATKADGEVAEISGICGPVCFGCSAFIEVLSGDELLLSAHLIHNRPPKAETPITFQLWKKGKPDKLVTTWTEGPVAFDYGTHWEYLGPIPGWDTLPPGKYYVIMQLGGMSGFAERTSAFKIE